MSTIFQMSRDELASLLLFLRPHHADTARLEALDARYLRVLIIEWLLLNGLSTLHKFERNENKHTYDDNVAEEDTGGEGYIAWQMPNKADCLSCGKYRVGKPIFSEAPSCSLPVTVTQPLPQGNMVNGTLAPLPLLYVNGDNADNFVSMQRMPTRYAADRPIRTKHGNLQRVHYSFRRDLPTTHNDSGSVSLQYNKLASMKKYSSVDRRQTNYVYYGDNAGRNGYDSARGDDKCADMCLVCLFCECAPPSEALKKRRADKQKDKRDDKNNNSIEPITTTMQMKMRGDIK